MRRGGRLFGWGLLTAMAWLAPAQAQSVRVRGTVETVAADTIALRDAQGATAEIELAPDWRVSVVAPIGVEAIQPGSFIGTTNVVQSDGTGRSVEVHVFPPGVKVGEGDRFMDEASGTKMTNGTVGQVLHVAGTSELDVAYPGGQRHIVVPSGTPIVSMAPGERTMVRPGIPIAAVTTTGPDGGRVSRYILVGVDGAPPPN